MNQRITEGTLAPTFKTEDIFGNVIDLQAYAGRPVLLSFYRNAACALCNLRVHQLIAHFPQFQAKGLALIGIFEAPRENMLQYVAKQDAPFPLVANPDTELYQLYGVEDSEAIVKGSMQVAETQNRVKEAAEAGYALIPEAGSNFNRMPADFLISPDGHIKRAFYSEILGTHLSFAEIEAYLNSLVQS